MFDCRNSLPVTVSEPFDMDVSAAGLLDPADLVFTALIAIALSGFPGLFLRRLPGIGQKIATSAMLFASLLGLAGAAGILAARSTHRFIIQWTLPFDSCEIAIDPLSALFLVPVFLVSGCATFYANGYWPASHNRTTEPTLTFFLGLLAAAMGCVLIARNGILFLMVWEVMALSAYFPMIAEHHSREVRRAGFVYLIATHVGTLALFVMFALLQSSTASFRFPEAHSLSATLFPATAIFVTGLLGFGVKAGLMPLHIWLPAAHANAPSHISAIMSGVMLKIGIYGIIRLISFFDAPPLWWGAVLLVAGSLSALLGIIFAIAQADLKRLLAYSSIENIGIITMGLGVALIGTATHNAALMTLGMTGALFHLLNHCLFKSLLFMGAGAVIHATGTRALDRMGGLSRHMPMTALCFLTGAVAICGLPPLNGFAGEYLLYMGFFSEARTAAIPYLALGAPLLAIIGGLAALCFVRLYGTTFLGTSRMSASKEEHESSLYMLCPMALLAILSLAAGLFPQAMVDYLRPVLAVWGEEPVAGAGAASLPPLQWLTYAGVALLAAGGGLAMILRRRLAATQFTTGSTWGCGYLTPGATMQYTSSSFGETATFLFRGMIRPHFVKPAMMKLFPRDASFAATIPETLLNQIIFPCFRATGGGFSFLRVVQMGKVHLYMLYIFSVLVLLLIWAY